MTNPRTAAPKGAETLVSDSISHGKLLLPDAKLHGFTAFMSIVLISSVVQQKRTGLFQSCRYLMSTERRNKHWLQRSLSNCDRRLGRDMFVEEKIDLFRVFVLLRTFFIFWGCDTTGKCQERYYEACHPPFQTHEDSPTIQNHSGFSLFIHRF
jgi:hypothetical protein